MTNERSRKNELSAPRKAKILVMDDDVTIRFLAEDMLSRMGFDVTTARNGEEAISLYEKEKASGTPFEVVILDITICAGLGGKETMQYLVEIDPGVKAIISSGSHQDPLMTDFFDHGFRGVLPKPYDIQALKESVSSAMGIPPLMQRK
jgi:two-component system cell cycle sensor histidine kinase/response regulator CckA